LEPLGLYQSRRDDAKSEEEKPKVDIYVTDKPLWAAAV